MDNIKSIIFDFDGTLHNTIKIYYPAFSSGVKTLQAKGFANNFELNEENVSKFLGEKPNYAYDLIAKDADENLKKEVMQQVGKNMEKNMQEGLGELYKGTTKVLETLYNNYDLYILSNCRKRYLDVALDVYNIKKYFKKCFVAESFDYIPKKEILKKVRPNIKEEIIFVGDRYHDINAAKENNIQSIFATYGFGPIREGKDANYKIDSIEEILKIL